MDLKSLCATHVEARIALPQSDREVLTLGRLMVTIRLEDAGSSSLCFSGWQCLLCGEVTDPVINVNRKELHGPTGELY